MLSPSLLPLGPLASPVPPIPRLGRRSKPVERRVLSRLPRHFHHPRCESTTTNPRVLRVQRRRRCAARYRLSRLRRRLGRMVLGRRALGVASGRELGFVTSRGGKHAAHRFSRDGAVRLGVIAKSLIVLGRAGERTGVTWRREGLGATHRSRTIEMNGRDGDRNRSPLRSDASSVMFATARSLECL
jgi:hypothetical protein